MDTNHFSWDIDRGSTSIKIMYDGKEVMSFYLGEAIEISGREPVTKILKEIERTPWIKAWHK